MKEAEKDPPHHPGPSENGRPSEEYRRFESLMKRLVRTPKIPPEKAERKRPA